MYRCHLCHLKNQLGRQGLCMYVLWHSWVYSILLKHLFHAGINSKAWRLVRTCYEEIQSCVRTGGLTSEYVSVNMDIRQGSVLSPTLYLLPSVLSRSDFGLNISWLSVESSTHADGIGTMNNSQQKLRDKIKAVNDVTKPNGLQLNLQKCEILMTERNNAPDTVDVDGAVIPVNSTVIQPIAKKA